MEKVRAFDNGAMEQYSYAKGVFEKNYNLYVEQKGFKENFTMLEFGCGDSVFSGIFAYFNGCKKTWLVDAGNFCKDSKSYISALKEHGKYREDMAQVDSFERLLEYFISD